MSLLKRLRSEAFMLAKHRDVCQRSWKRAVRMWALQVMRAVERLGRNGFNWNTVNGSILRETIWTVSRQWTFSWNDWFKLFWDSSVWRGMMLHVFDTTFETYICTKSDHLNITLAVYQSQTVFRGGGWLEDLAVILLPLISDFFRC